MGSIPINRTKNNLKPTKNMQNGQELAEVPQPQIEKVAEYRPSDEEALREYRIEIRFLSRGCIVSVGCKEIAFENVASAMDAVNLYVANPWNEQQKWRKLLK